MARKKARKKVAKKAPVKKPLAQATGLYVRQMTPLRQSLQVKRKLLGKES